MGTLFSLLRTYCTKFSKIVLYLLWLTHLCLKLLIETIKIGKNIELNTYKVFDNIIREIYTDIGIIHEVLAISLLMADRAEY